MGIVITDLQFLFALDCIKFIVTFVLNREMLGEEDSGIEGILNRLERDRNLSFGINLRENVHGTHASSKDDGDHRHFGSSADSGELQLIFKPMMYGIL